MGFLSFSMKIRAPNHGHARYSLKYNKYILPEPGETGRTYMKILINSKEIQEIQSQYVYSSKGEEIYTL